MKDFPSDFDKFERVPINEDKEWETDFVPWLEALEKKGVGVEDGFFVATFSNSIRKVNENNEGNFVEACVEGLNAVVIQRLKQFDKALTMHYGVQSLLDEGKLRRFKEQTADIKQYHEDTCCSSILRKNGLQALLFHLDSFIHTKKSMSCSAKMTGWASSSRVIVEEVGEQLKKKYNKFKESTEGFQWDSNKSVPPLHCEEAECGMGSDSQESADDEEVVIPQNCKRKKMQSQSQTNDTNLLLYGFGNSDNLTGDLKITDKFCMTRLFNLLWLLPNLYPGFHSSYFFYGTCHSIFPIHVEDGLTFSANYVYTGQPKLWVMIPPWGTSLLEYHMQRCGSFLFYMHCSNFLGHKTLVPTIQSLIEFDIPFKIVVQQPGDMVVLYPNTAHYGFNLGRNFAEAINFAIPSWVPWGAMARKCSCLAKQIHIPMRPFLVAFRPELLEDLEHGRTITTPQFVRGMQLLASEVEKLGKHNTPALTACRTSRGDMMNRTTKHEAGHSSSSGCQVEGEYMKVCPLPKCGIRCKSEKDMKKHVRVSHRPLLGNEQFMEQIEHLFQES